MKSFQRIIDLIVRCIQIVVIMSVLLITLVTIVDVGRRYILNESSIWAEEMARFLLVWVTFLGGSLAFRQGELVGFELLKKKLSGKMVTVYHLLLNGVIIIFLAFLVEWSFRYVFSGAILLQHSTGLNLPMMAPYIAIPVGLSFMILFSVEGILRSLGHMRKGE